MQTKTVKCPSCGVVLEVRNSQNEEVKIINCPQCGMGLRVRFQQQGKEMMDADTFIPGYGDGNDTEIAGLANKADKVFIVCEGRRYELQEGINIVGRKSNQSSADVQLEVTDRYISRQNAIVKVKKTDGHLLVTIANYKNPNPIKIRSLTLLNNDEVMLENGDIITMGLTKMTLKKE